MLLTALIGVLPGREHNQQYLPGTSESWITVQMSRAFFDQVRSTPVTLHFTVALTRVQAGNARSIPLPAQDFSVPDFGICSPQPDLFHQSIFRNCLQVCPAPTQAYVYQRALGRTVRAQHRSLILNTGVQGDAWIGSLETSPADFGIAPIWSPSIGLSNGIKVEGAKSEPRHLCPGTPVTFTQYNLVGRTQYDFTIPDFRFPGYQPDTGLFNGALGFDITAQ